MPSSGAIGQIVLLVVLHRLGRRCTAPSTASTASPLGDFSPDATVFIAVAPVLLYSFVGIELPATAGEEMVDPRRDIPVAILRAGIAQALMYGVPILAVLFVLPPRQISSLHGLIDAMSAVFTVYGGGRATRSGVIDGRACSSGCCWPAARRGSWAPAAPRQRPAWTAAGRRCSAASASAPACPW